MLPNMQNTYEFGANSALVRHKVLRNTYALLALTMIPTVLGAFIGVQMNFQIGGILGLVAVLAMVYGFPMVIDKYSDSGMGVALLLGFTFFMGFLLAPLLTRTLGFTNGGSLIMMAFGGTASILAVMAGVATVSKRDFSGMGKWLGIAMLLAILASIANIFLGMSLLSIVISVVVIGISSAFILYEVQQVVNGGETNYIRAAMSLYFSVFNIFTSLLSLLGLGGDRD
jgi:modulator of FtsH protease